MRGPNFTRAGQPVISGDQTPLDERLAPALAAALAEPGIDILACDWSVDDLDSDQLGRWWSTQSMAIRREMARRLTAGLKLTVRRRLDRSDGLYKCYVRANRIRPKAVAV